MKTKRYPTARLRRLVLDAALGFTQALAPLPPYLHILGATKAGRALLRAVSPTLPVSSSLSWLSAQSSACSTVASAHSAALDFAALCLRTAQPCARAHTVRFYVEKRSES